LIDEPLSTRWRYDLGNRKIYEFRSALGLDAEGPAPRGAVFAYAIVPALARMLTHPEVSSRRDEFRMSRLEVAFASELDMRGELICSIETLVRDSIVGKISCRDVRGAQAVATLHLDDAIDPPAPRPDLREVAELRFDRARCIAFAAATWDLNPAYWDREFAEAAGLRGLVTPPGLPVSLAMEEVERQSGRPVAAVDVAFERAGRPGEIAQLLLASAEPTPSFEIASESGVLLSGHVMLGPPVEASVTS
jgi:hypothetical protein